MASRAMAMLFQDLRRTYASQTIIVDLPPILSSDDVLAILPQVDCVLLVVAVGTTKVAEIEECTRHLQSTEVVRIAVNKVPNANAAYGYYSSRKSSEKINQAGVVARLPRPAKSDKARSS